jgi:hypothetical protein
MVAVQRRNTLEVQRDQRHPAVAELGRWLLFSQSKMALMLELD